MKVTTLFFAHPFVPSAKQIHGQTRGNFSKLMNLTYVHIIELYVLYLYLDL